MTFYQWAQHCRQFLEDAGVWFGHGTDNAADEAAWLVLSVIEAPVDGSFDGWDETASALQAKQITDILRARVADRVPLAYLTGEAWFCGFKFFVDQNVLVPRSPVAELIHHRFAPWLDTGSLERALDLCTGSGCIGISMAITMPWLKVDLSDISPSAIRVAGLNCKAHGVEERVGMIESDLFKAMGDQRYGLIVSNPPYVSAAVFDTLPAEYRAEPEIALVSDCQGLEIPLRILLQSPDFLLPDGVLICEVGENAGLLESVLPELPLTWLAFENGGSGVFTIGREALLEQRPAIRSILEKLRDVA
jgi:ribosomal protein L3 glutamine methyltransferase